jgi:hypothetical protein
VIAPAGAQREKAGAKPRAVAQAIAKPQEDELTPTPEFESPAPDSIGDSPIEPVGTEAADPTVQPQAQGSRGVVGAVKKLNPFRKKK